MSAPRIRPLSREHVHEVRELENLVWFGDPEGMTDELYATLVDWDRLRGAHLDGHGGLAGVYGTLGFALGLPGGAVVDLTLPVALLTAAHLGQDSVATLARAHEAAEHTPGALFRLSTTMSWPVPPVGAYEF